MSTNEIIYGACGVEGCTECLPQFDANNNPMETPADAQ